MIGPMHLATRPWITAGIALVGNSIVAVTPVAAPRPGLPDLQVRAVQLATAFDPITEWEDVFQTASTNATAIFDDWSAAPFPVLQQVIANQEGYFQDLLSNPADISTVLTDIQDRSPRFPGRPGPIHRRGARLERHRWP